MKKIIILLVGAITMASCGTTSEGAFSGAMFGGIIGSCIGGISGGPRGSDIGTLVGMATGAAAGAAVANAAEKERIRSYYASQGERDYDGTRGVEYDEGNVRSEKPIYDDVISMDPVSDNIIPQQSQSPSTDIVISNVRFINDANTQHISKGELVKIAFEIRNVSILPKYNIVPMVQETTGNKRLLISPSTMIETLDAHKAIRYTAFISAQDNLKTGAAHFRISVLAGKTLVSNIVEFDIPLN